MLTCLRPGQLAGTFLWASRNSWSRPGFPRKRTALNAVMVAPPFKPCWEIMGRARPVVNRRALAASIAVTGTGASAKRGVLRPQKTKGHCGLRFTGEKLDMRSHHPDQAGFCLLQVG